MKSFSRVLGFVGAAVFVFGGKFLHQFKHMNFLVPELIDITAGLSLMFLAAAAGGKIRSAEKHLD